MISVDVRFDGKALALELGKIQASATGLATARALNRAATSVRAEVVRQVRRELPLPAGSLRKRFAIVRATRANLAAVIRAGRDYDPALSRFDPRWKRGQPGGASVKLPGAGRVTVLGAFTGATPYGRTGVFKRVGAGRYPIKFLRASDAGLPTVRAAFLQAAADSATQRIARERFRAEYERELRFRASRAGVIGG